MALLPAGEPATGLPERAENPSHPAADAENPVKRPGFYLELGLPKKIPAPAPRSFASGAKD